LNTSPRFISLIKTKGNFLNNIKTIYYIKIYSYK